ncbi:MAG: conserved rane protein of unknown function [Bacillota bacterium]|jgi:hypothetical protein|nr:conserved rane protein of unknown function [Bacillota bacterium]
MVTIFVGLLILIALITGIVLLQIFLSKKESKWPGLVLPMIGLLIAIIAVFNIASFTSITTTGSGEVINGDGTVIQEITPEIITQGDQSTPSLVFTIVSVFLLYNIPTAILLAIYFSYREKPRQKKAIEKMKVQDL